MEKQTKKYYHPKCEVVTIDHKADLLTASPEKWGEEDLFNE